MIKMLLKKTLRPLKTVFLKTRWGDVWNCRKRIQSANAKGMHKHVPINFVPYRKNRIHQFQTLFERIRITLSPNKRFQFWIDENLYFVNRGQLTDALSPEFSMILEN